MRLILVLCVLLTTCVWGVEDAPKQVKHRQGPAVAEGPVIREVWSNRLNPQGRLGWVQTLSYYVEEQGKKLIRTVVRDHIRYLRSGDPYMEENEQYSLEDEEGTVLEIGYRTSLGKNQDLVVRGRPDGNSIELEVLDQSGKKVVYRQKKPWDSRARGILFQDRYLEGIKDWTTGKTYTVYGFVQTLNAVAPGTFTVLGKKKMTLHGEERELVELEQSYPRECYLEKSRHYVDPETGVSWMTTEDSSLFDVISHIRCNKAQALAPFAGTVRDHDVPVTMDKPIPMTLLELPSKLKLALEMSEEEHPEQVFLNTPRQQFLQKQGKRSEFRLTAKPKSYPPEPMPGPEYLESNFYIRSEDAHVKKLAMEIVGEAKTTEAKMKRIHRWVGKNVKGGYEVGFATADEVARTLEGDCTEMGVLAAALGRVAGIPSRVCFGLVYDPTHAGFGGHLWIEAYVDNCWKTYDPTGVLDVLGAAYLRIDGYSMANVLIPDELPGVRRGFAGRMKVYLLEHR